MQPHTTIPLFSHFLFLKHQNPSAYWSKATQASMVAACQHYGPEAFFDYSTQATT